MIEIFTYCQPTQWNDRLVSLLSAVLLNPIRPDFTRAIDEKPSVRRPHRRNQPVVEVVILLPPFEESEKGFWKACKRLRRRIQKFAIRFSLHVTFVNCNQSSQENFVQTLNDIAKVTDRYFLLSLDRKATAFKSILGNYQGDQGLRLLGCVVLQPNVGSDKAFDILINKYSHLPILLLSPVGNQRFIQAANNTSPLLLLALLSDNHSLSHWFDDEMISVWMARTIAKYVEATTLMTANDELTPQRSKL